MARRRSPKPRSALITGASGGIGAELARVFARNGADVVLASRNVVKLELVARSIEADHAVRAAVIQVDLSLPDAAEQLCTELDRREIRVDTLVNNAGFGIYGPFADMDARQVLELIQVNIAALTHLCALLLPPMMERGHGRIMNVASTAAFQPGPLMAAYYASKSYVLHFSEALAYELADTGVTVSTLCPGPTESAFWDRAAAGDSRISDFGMMDARTVAEIGYRGLMAGKSVVIPGLLNRVLARGYRFLPRRAGTRLVGRLQSRRDR